MDLSDAQVEAIAFKKKTIAGLSKREGDELTAALPTIAQLTAEIRRLEGRHEVDPRDAEIERLTARIVELEMVLEATDALVSKACDDDTALVAKGSKKK